MTEFKFYKYQGAGNDFVLFDCIHDPHPNLTQAQIEKICDRRFGIGADGLMYILPSGHSDFKMQYFNADGRESTMCGNGGRCIAHLAHHLKICKPETTFEAIDGLHHAQIEQDNVKLGMIDVHQIETNEKGDYILNTGSPHYIHFTSLAKLETVLPYGQSIRYNETYKEQGINVNMACFNDDILHVVTYERGVENETLACGTGVTAAALALSNKQQVSSPVIIKSKGGMMKIHFTKNGDHFENVVLEGPAMYVFDGKINI
jgi:diaminopimelate epimerase